MWKYSFAGEGFFEKNGILCLFRDEDAYWNSECQKEVFLHPDVTWVNFITFPIDPNICED